MKDDLLNKNYIPEELNSVYTIKIVDILSSIPNKVEFVKFKIIDSNIIQFQFKLYNDNSLPITLDIVHNTYIHPKKIIYMLPGGGLNFESNFLTPITNNISTFLSNKGYIIIGITPRENNIPTDNPNFDYSMTKNWNLEFHTNDVNKVINLIQKIIPNNYEILGQSAGAVVALNYASKTNDKKLKAARIIDIVGQYSESSQEFTYSQLSKSATEEVISQGIYIDSGFQNLKLLSVAARTNPSGDSGVPRYPLPGNFTYEGLLYFSAINTNQLPGLLTPITGLPDSWNFKRGFFAGTYDFDQINPINDKYNFTHTDVDTIYFALDSINSGVFPLAEQRDFYALWSNSYPLNWSNIKVPVYWINTELGFGDVSHSISLLNSSKVIYSVVNNYGHGDPTFSRTAQIDFWNVLFPLTK